jgi:hypothetical protein
LPKLTFLTKGKNPMILRSSAGWLVPVAITLLSIGTGAKRAVAQVTLPFETVYEIQDISREIAPGVLEVNLLGESADAPYGLTNITTLTYSRLDPNTGMFTFSADPAAVGLEGLPFGMAMLFGSTNDRLFGNSGGSGVIDFESFSVTDSGTINITGGSGRFRGATGTLNFSGKAFLSPEPNAPSRGQALVSGTIQVSPSQTVPEPNNTTAVTGMGVIGAAFLLHRQRHKAVSHHRFNPNL